jgi:hypothetical protein
MKKTYNKALELFLIVLLSTSINAQTKEYKVISKEMSFDLKNDTLYSTTGLKIFVGQKFVEGNAASEGEQYRSIISTKAALVPSIWGQDNRYESAIENFVD